MTTLKSYIKIRSSHRDKTVEMDPCVYDIKGYGYDFEKPANQHGEIAGETHGGKIEVEIVGYPAEWLLHWAFTPYRLMDGEIVLYDNRPETVKEKISFEAARCIAFHLGFDARTNGGTRTLLTLQALKMEVGDSLYTA